MTYPQSLAETTLEKWGKFTVPEGANAGVSFDEIGTGSKASCYRNKPGNAFWLRSLREYVKQCDMVGKGSLREYVKTQDVEEERSEEWLEIETEEKTVKKPADLKTVVMKLPPGTKVTLTVPSDQP